MKELLAALKRDLVQTDVFIHARQTHMAPRRFGLRDAIMRREKLQTMIDKLEAVLNE